MPSKAFLKFVENRHDVLLLWHAHREMLGKTKKLNSKAEVINRATIVFITAFWESYIEDLAEEAYNILLGSSAGESVVPNMVRSGISRTLQESNNPLNLWQLAGDGWRTLLNDHKDRILKERIEYFHSPKSEKVKELFSDLLGIRDITRFWVNDTLDANACRVRLDEFITMRGNIAHRIRHDKRVFKRNAKDYMSLVNFLCTATDNAVLQHLYATTGSEPWKDLAENPGNIS
ncbi:HEPN domain-containing protein [Deinococcus yunweiensis]|uniref:HEPN domain-containing protein n=1 Tax=Deinococcus yunweiensis TaxID=367282 RepID=UPI00398F7E46